MPGKTFAKKMNWTVSRGILFWEGPAPSRTNGNPPKSKGSPYNSTHPSNRTSTKAPYSLCHSTSRSPRPPTPAHTTSRLQAHHLLGRLKLSGPK
jgi:uncharacterized protein YciI